MRHEAAIGIFARAPVAGAVKTRLQPALSPAEALELHVAMLTDTVEGVRRAMAGVAEVSLWWSEAWEAADDLAAALAGIETRVQVGSDLGERMARAIQDRLGGGATRVVLIGSDAPTLPPDRLHQALSILADHDVVLGPAEDGGYYLIGARRLHPSLFMKISWGTAQVLSMTRRRLKQGGIPYAELAPWRDVDTPADLARLWLELRHMKAKGLPGLPQRTWRLLARIAPGRLPMQ